MKHLTRSKLKAITKSIAAASLIAVSALAPIGLQAQTIALDKVVAVVDDDVVMASELNQRMGMIVGQLQNSGTQLPPEDILRSQVLERLITESLQLQMARRAGYSITEAQVNQHLERMVRSNNMTRADFEQKLAADGLTIRDLLPQIRRDLILEQVQRSSVSRRIQISDHEVKNFLNSKQGQYWSLPDYLLGHILIAASTPNAEDQANAATEAARNGTDFRRLAVAQSSGQNALQGGDLGWRKAAQMPDIFIDVISDMNKGEVSDPIRSGAGYHVLKVYDIRGTQEQLVMQNKARHILIKPSAILTDDEARQKLAGIRKQIVNGADFAELAKEHSEDPGSMLSGGSLGWSLPGQMVPEFEQVMNNIPVGEISQPFRSQFGWHILKVDERRDQDMSEEVRTNKARQLLTNQRFEEERTNWLIEIRDQAYVEIK